MIYGLWDGGVCPAMDTGPLVTTARSAAWETGINSSKVSRHLEAIGYQWNSCMRGTTSCGGACGYTPPCGYIGRSCPGLEDWTIHPRDTWESDTLLSLPDGSSGWNAQAVRPDEVESAQTKAEAWDTFDLDTTPGIPFSQYTDNWMIEHSMPGWHIGPFTDGTNGRVLFNAGRHQGSPNILYADGHVSADATNTDIINNAAISGVVGPTAKVTSYTDFDPTWGNLNRIAPKLTRR
jgi:prepilin-type processing-associated H-X9-DG protein